jgi:transposase
VDRFPEGRDRPRAIGRTKGGLNSKLHMLSDGKGRPLNFFLSPGQMADRRGALVLLRHLPPAKRFLGDKAYDADWLRDGLKDRGIRPCIPPRKTRKKPARYNKRLYRKRYRIENAFGRLKDWPIVGKTVHWAVF